MPIWLQHIFPTRLFSYLLGWLARCQVKVLKNWFIRRFVSHYGVDLSVAIHTNYQDYTSFHDFFTRPLKSGVRPICRDGFIASPVDGAVSELGVIQKGQLLQAKGHHYDLAALLAGRTELVSLFENGHFLTAYLSPKDYHRVHMPLRGSLLQMIYVPGRLFSVNQKAVQNIPGLFARNERVINIFQTEAGCMAVIMVGAMVVGSIYTKWYNQVAPNKSNMVEQWYYNNDSVRFAKGDEMGFFTLGSTVIVLFEEDQVNWNDTLKMDSPLQLGQSIGTLR